MSRSPRAWVALALPLLSVALPLSACSEYEFIEEKNRDVFEQVRKNTVDVLLVVDNSCSMIDEQEKLAASFDTFISAFDGVDVDWQIGAVTTDMADIDQSGRLLGGDDEVVLLSAEGRTLDQVAWNRNWAVGEGAALQLDRRVVTASGNDDRQAWCFATDEYGDGDLGTPGASNNDCVSYSGGDPDPAEGSGELRTPVVNDLLITELMINPSAVPDAQGEWVEITNTSLDEIDLSGCQLTDSSDNETSRGVFAFPSGTTLGPQATLVVGRAESDNGGVPVDLAAGSELVLANSDLFLTPQTEDPAEQFAELVSVGAGGVGIEMGLEAARTALSPELVEGDNAGFLRDDANLSLIFVSDENDYSPAPVDEYLRFFNDLKGQEAYRYPGLVTISAVAGVDQPEYEGQPSCESDGGFAFFGLRYLDLASRTGGAAESICDDDFGPIAAELGLLASGLELEFVLSEPANEETLVVKLYEDQSDESYIRDLEKDVEWTYVPQNNAIRFEPDQVPPSQTVIVAEYEVLGTGARRGDTGSAR